MISSRLSFALLFLLLPFVSGSSHRNAFFSASAFVAPLASEDTAGSTNASPIPPPPPISKPVWSLAAPSASKKHESTPSTSMNIVTFATAVALTPKLWIVSLFHRTMTKDSFCEHGGGILQLLTPSQKDLVPVLGKRSGYENGYSKEEESANLGMDWIDATHFAGTELKVLPQCASYLQLELVSTMEAGDHLVVLCEVVQIGSWDEATQTVTPLTDESTLAFDPENTLYTALLREEGTIS